MRGLLTRLKRLERGMLQGGPMVRKLRFRTGVKTAGGGVVVDEGVLPELPDPEGFDRAVDITVVFVRSWLAVHGEHAP